MTQIHERRGTTFSNVAQRGDAKPAQLACLTLPELERILALVVDTYHHTVHAATGERPVERYLAYYRRPDLSDLERVPPRLPARRFLLDFLPYERRALMRCGFQLFRIDYSSRDLLGMWRRDNGHRVVRTVAYDPRSLATIWVLDEVTGDYIAVPYRVPHPDMTLAESEEARCRLRALKAADRTERRLFKNIAAIRAIEAQAKTTTARRKAERIQQARRGAEEAAIRLLRPGASPLDDVQPGPSEVTDVPRVPSSSSPSPMSRSCEMLEVAATHLDESVRPILRFNDVQRIARIDRDLWIGYGRARDVQARLERILRSERRMRPDNLLIVGPSNNGKSAIARRFHAQQTLPEDPAAEQSHIPVALIQAPNEPRIPQLLTAIIAALGRDVAARRTAAQLRNETYRDL